MGSIIITNILSWEIKNHDKEKMTYRLKSGAQQGKQIAEINAKWVDKKPKKRPPKKEQRPFYMPQWKLREDNG
jgi:hypothetical protein